MQLELLIVKIMGGMFMKRKQVLVLVMATLMTMFLFVGCSSKQETVKSLDKEVTSSEKETTASKENEQEVEKKLEFPLSEPITYDVFASSDANDVEIGDALFMKKSLEGTNITLNITHVLNSERLEKRNLLLNSNNYPDFFYKAGFLETELEEYGVEAGILIPLEDMINEYAPNLKAFLDEKDAWDYLKSSDGHIYSLPYYERPICNGMTYWINQEWLKELGMNEPKSYDDLYNVLKTFKENDMNGDGDLNNEIPLACYADGNAIPRKLLDYADYKYDETTRLAVDNGEVIYFPTDERYKEFIAYLTKLYNEGLLYEHCYTSEADAVTALGFEEKLGSFFGWGAHPVVGGPDTTGLDADYIILTPFQKGTYPITTGFTVGTLAITDKCKSPEIVVKWADQFYSEEGGILATMGVEGETYKINSDGTWNWIFGEGYGDTEREVRDHTGNGGAKFPVRWPDFWYENMSPDFGTEVHIIEQRMKAAALGEVALPIMKYTPEQTDELSTLVVSINDYMDEYEAKVVTGKLDLNSSWDEYLKTMESMGAGRVEEIYKEVYENSAK